MGEAPLYRVWGWKNLSPSPQTQSQNVARHGVRTHGFQEACWFSAHSPAVLACQHISISAYQRVSMSAFESSYIIIYFVMDDSG